MGKVFLLFLMLSFAFSCSTYLPQKQYSQSSTIQLFYDELSPYGKWVHNREYGYVWIPHSEHHFFPYSSNGRWIYTNQGWTWYSDYEWGWAVFHYGSWDLDPQYGWFWFPGYEWAPAWVNWRQGNGYIGWSPVKPESELGWDFKKNDEAFRWVFIRERDFGRWRPGRHYLSKRKNNDIIGRTEIIPKLNSGLQGWEEIISGPDPRIVEGVSGRKIKQITVKSSAYTGAKVINNDLEIFRPILTDKIPDQRPAPLMITDIKDIRPNRDLKRIYPRASTETVFQNSSNPGQGIRLNVNIDTRNVRKDEVQRRINQKRQEIERRKSEKESIQKQNKPLKERDRISIEKYFRQRRAERFRKTEQQKKLLRKERDQTLKKRTGNK
jgi:hypothetical protein